MNHAKPQFDYQNFDLLIEPAGHAYVARVTNSPAGEAVTKFNVPFSALELENFLLKIGRPRRGVRRLNSPEMDAAKVFGKRLFDSVFGSEVFGCLRSSLDQTEAQGSAGLRLRLRLNAPELADLPWEYLYNAALNRFLVLAVETPLVRYIELPERIRPLAVQPPLKILVMLSSPTDYAPLDVEEEWMKLQNALGDLQKRKLVTLERLNEATLPALQRRLRQSQYHIFHFIGHGGYDESARDGVLLLEDETRHSRKVSGQFLGTILHNHRPLRLAVLNACEGARPSRTDPFTGTAQSLVQQGLPAVIAMQFEITDAAAITLSHEFYTALADGYPVDAALVEARTAIYAGGNDVEWGTPVLYMRAPDGKIFDIERTPPPPPIRETPKPKVAPVSPPPRQPLVEKPKPMAPPQKPPGSPKRPLLLAGLVLTLAVFVWLIYKNVDWSQPPVAPTLLSITTTPANATVLVDGSAIGNTPITGHRGNAGKLTLRIQKLNYFSRDTTIILAAGRETKLALTLKAALARVTIQVTPVDAEVILDGESLAASKRQQQPVSIGMHSLNLSRPGYKPKQIQFRVTAARDTTLRYNLDSEVVAENGTIRVQAFLDGRVYIDNDFKGNIAAGETREYDQPVGSYKVEVRGANENVSQNVSVVKGKTVTAILRPKPAALPTVRRLRPTPRTDFSVDEAKSMVLAKGFFDNSWNKAVSGFANDYESRTISGEQVVVDKASGLMWQRGGSTKSMTYADAQTFIRQLNTNRFAGFSDWRLPTLEEAMSLMERSELNGDLYIDPKFDKTQRWIWTDDKQSAGVAWVALFDLGYCGYNDVASNFSYVRAVRVPVGQ